MSIYGHTTLICIMLLVATEAISVEPNEAEEVIYQEEAFPEESIEGSQIEEDEVIKEKEGTGELIINETNTERSTEDETTQEINALEPEKIDEELYSGEAFPEEPLEDKITKQENMFSALDAPHKYVSEHVEWLGTEVDKYFANEAFYNYSTDSYVQLLVDVLHEEEFAETSYGANLRARVDLPGTKRRFKLLIDTNPTEKQDPIERSVDETPAAAVQESDVYAAVERERERKGWLIRPSVGAKFNFPIEPFVRLRLTNLFPLQRWQLRVNENLYWFDDSGFGSDSTFDFDLPVGNGHLFRTTSFARWTEETNYFELNQIITFFQTLSPTRRISYQIGVYGQTSPTLFMNDYLAVIRYRQNIHKDWLFFEIRPQVLYQKENDWDDEVSLLLRLEWLFGRRYL